MKIKKMSLSMNYPSRLPLTIYTLVTLLVVSPLLLFGYIICMLIDNNNIFVL